jgi:hypothetical protein
MKTPAVDVWTRRDGKWTAIATTMTRVVADAAAPAAR